MLYASEKIATIVYFNDAHEISPVNDLLGSRGGIARVKTVVDHIRAKNPQAIIIFGGDLAGGTLFGAVYRGLPMVRAFNLLPVHLANFGQHDFDFGPEHTRSLIRHSEFTWFSSNLKEADGSTFAGLATYKLISRGQSRIGFIALTDAMSTTMPSDQVIQIDPYLAAERSLAMLRMENPHVVIAITQMSADKNERLLRQQKNIQLIFSEERYEDKSTIVYLGNRPLITPCGNMGSLIQVDILAENDDYRFDVRVHPIDQTIAEHPQMLLYQTTYQDSLETKLAKSLATVQTELDAGINTDFACRWRETTLGNLISDAFRWHHQADLAVINGGGIRANIPSGIMTLKNAYATLPFGNRIVLVRTDGHTIRKMLEHGVKFVEEKDGSFLQVSGASYHYDPTQPRGKRVSSIKIQNKPLQTDQLYLVALPDFILKGGNHFSMLKNAEIVVPPEEAEIDVYVFTLFVQQLGTIDYQLENRIQIP